MVAVLRYAGIALARMLTICCVVAGGPGYLTPDDPDPGILGSWDVRSRSRFGVPLLAGFWIHSYGPRWGFGPQRGPGSGGPNRRNGVPDQPPPLPARGPVCSRDHTLILLDSGSGGRRPRGARIQRKVLMDLGSRVGSRRPGPAYAASTWVPGGSQWAILGSYAAIDHCCSILRARA